MMMMRKESLEYSQKPYAHILEEFFGQEIDGKIYKPLMHAGYNRDFRRVVKLPDLEIDNLKHEFGKWKIQESSNTTHCIKTACSCYKRILHF